MYPQKAEDVGERVLRGLVDTASARAGGLGVTSETGRALIAGLMFGFGHGVLDDPLYPWVARTLNQQLVPDPNERAQRLHEKTRVYIDYMLQHLNSFPANA
jgi:hypothetical protein